MKRTPLSIVIDLILSLNCHFLNEEYTINTLAENTNIHWETTNRYLEIIKKIQDFSPSLTLTTNNKIKLLAKNSLLKIEDDDLILLHCLQNRAFNESSAISIPSSLITALSFLVSSNFGQLLEEDKFFLNKRGKQMALDAHFEIQEKIRTNPSDSLFNLDTTTQDVEYHKLVNSNVITTISNNIAEKIWIKLEENVSMVDREGDVVAAQYAL